MKKLRKLTVLTVCWLFTSLAASLYAQTTVNLSSAGTLSEKITDKNVTHLILTGHIDARDFLFMRDNMSNLSVVDLSGVTIDAYQGTGGPAAETGPSGLICGNVATGYVYYQANEIPACSFY